MILLTDNVWIGIAQDVCDRAVGRTIKSALNVAQDLDCERSWSSGVEYWQVGLVDGPGNPTSAYCAAVMAVDALVRKGQVLVYCHEGGRSLAVVLMYVNVLTRLGWDECMQMIEERVDADLPKVHPAHRAAFEKIQWRLLDAAHKQPEDG